MAHRTSISIPTSLSREQLINFVQMGDGAGAVKLGANDGTGRHLVSDIFAGQIGTGMQPGISISGGGSVEPSCEFGLPYFEHRAGDVRRNGEQLIAAGIAAIKSRGYNLGDFDWIIPHQGERAHCRPVRRTLPGNARQGVRHRRSSRQPGFRRYLGQLR